MNVNGLKQTLGKKAGPLPIGAWVLIGLVGFMVARYLRARNAASAQDVNANLTDQTPSDAASLGALGGTDPGYDWGGDTGGDSGGGVGGTTAPSGDVDTGAGGDGGNVGPTAPAASTTPSPTPTTAATSPDAPADSGHPQAVSKAVVDKAVGVVVKGLKFGEKAAQKKGTSSTTAGRDSNRTTTGHAPELVSEHGRGGGFQPHPAPAGHKTSKAVEKAGSRKLESAAEPAHSVPAMMAVAAPSGHSPALAPSAAPSTVAVATTASQYHHSGHKEETDG